ncbi:MAG: ABC transporter permease subunit [Treponema sp.]|uniref:ABC transporter permease subunit n=1 Tax=Treponema sp. TaxID=166 RepID=UPI001B68FAD7|nr:ABC transporter permease subunit [Treponema sp.]MBP5588025.1 ABC transporter permease subunit [Treponema sp.]MCR5386211.1 ABC transporter permease subunit [Treponema sp.]
MTKKKNNIVCVIAKRELKSYFTNPVAYIVTAIFLIATGVFFYSTFFLNKRAELRNFFTLLPLTFSFTIPAITMRLFAEEQKSGSIETLMTLPVTETQVVLGKFLCAFISSAAMLVPTLFYVITLLFFGKPDFGPIIGGYLGAVLLCAVYSSIGIFASSITKNQITALFTGLAINCLLTLIQFFIIFLPGRIVNAVSFFAISTHFNSVSRGIVDTRDICYFLLIITIFILATIRSQEARRK